MVLLSLAKWTNKQTNPAVFLKIAVNHIGKLRGLISRLRPLKGADLAAHMALAALP